MLGSLALSIVAVTILATSFISGIFGMAGGLILLGVLLVFMEVAPAMVLFGVIQTASNGWRSALWLRHVDWGIVWRYLVGSTLMFLALRLVAVLPSKATLYIGLGLIPFAADLLPKKLTPDITRPGAPYICGAFIITLQLLAGAAGHILDIFFQKSRLDRKTIVGTKAVTQVTGHLYRILYFGSFEFAFDMNIPWWAYGGAIALSIMGTSLAAPVLLRMSDVGFRVWSRRLTLTIASVYLARGLWLLV
jgi:uncharacterized membrane protein YfcA